MVDPGPCRDTWGAVMHERAKTGAAEVTPQAARTVDDVAPVGYDAWMRMAAEEYRRLIELLDALDPEEWSRSTDCDGWDVRAVVAHLDGAAASSTSNRETLRQFRAGRRLLPDADSVDAMNEVQVRERADRPPERLVMDLEAAAPRAVRARTRIPRPVRALRVPFGPPLGTRPYGYLMGRILTRDAWLHRVDICRATGRPLTLTTDHDAPLIEDVVVEWANKHGAPFDLLLTGPAGGRWRRGRDGEVVEVDAVEFCRILSGRAVGAGLLTTSVPF
jgi:uncharacterized protein (TIGR03083 family)